MYAHYARGRIYEHCNKTPVCMRAVSLISVCPIPVIICVLFHVTRWTADRRILMQTNRAQQNTAQDQPPKASGLPQPQADTARSGNRKRSAPAWPSDPGGSHNDPGTSGSEAINDKQEQQQQSSRGVHGQRVQPPMPAKAKAAAANKDWSAAVSAFLLVL